MIAGLFPRLEKTEAWSLTDLEAAQAGYFTSQPLEDDVGYVTVVKSAQFLAQCGSICQ